MTVDYMEVQPAVQSKGLVLKHYDDTNYGYLRITVDKKFLRIGFHQVGQASISQSRVDMVSVELATAKVVANLPDRQLSQWKRNNQLIQRHRILYL